MKVFLLLLATSILGWQYLTVTTTLKSRIQERTNQIDYVINEYLGELYVQTNRIDKANERLEVLKSCNCKEYSELELIIKTKGSKIY